MYGGRRSDRRRSSDRGQIGCVEPSGSRDIGLQLLAAPSKVSCEAPGDFDVDIVRVVCGDDSEGAAGLRFEDLPSGVFVRGFIKAYASAVDIDAGEVLARFDEQRPQAMPPAPLASVRSRRRYGAILLAITTAAVFAIIVATFALVRRAPAQDDPIELSSAVPCQVEAARVERSCYVPSTIATPTGSSRS